MTAICGEKIEKIFHSKVYKFQQIIKVRDFNLYHKTCKLPHINVLDKIFTAY